MNTIKPEGPAVSPAKPIARARKRLTRAARAPEAREAIFRAAVEVIGKHGYHEASISRVTQAAGIAQGTFYLYFQSRQELFDELLPHAGKEMLQFIRDQVSGARGILDVEERGFRALFAYMAKNPGFNRVINEAEIAAPEAHRKHVQLLIRHYVESLERGIKAGQIKLFDRSELEAIAYILMSVRNNLYLRYAVGAEGPEVLPEDVVQTYLKLVSNGLR
jgi:AcrR family transcriptional regulator